MPTFSVHMTMAVSTTVTVEAGSVEEALETVYDSPDMPGSITLGAFGPASVDEAGEWEPVVIYQDGNYNVPVWQDRS